MATTLTIRFTNTVQPEFGSAGKSPGAPFPFLHD